MNKDTIRSKIRATKALLTHQEKKTAAARVWEVVESTAAFMLADRILMYHSLNDELDTIDFLAKWHDRKRFFLPRVHGVNLELLPLDFDNLVQGAFSIMEPSEGDAVSVDDIELIIVPGVAYDRRGNRVGRGKGFYDRLLGESRAMKIGVGYDFQLVDEIDSEPHDIPVDAVITDRRTVIVRRKRK